MRDPILSDIYVHFSSLKSILELFETYYCDGCLRKHKILPRFSGLKTFSCRITVYFELHIHKYHAYVNILWSRLQTLTPNDIIASFIYSLYCVHIPIVLISCHSKQDVKPVRSRGLLRVKETQKTLLRWKDNKRTR